MFFANTPTNQADAAEVTGLIKQKRQPSSPERPEKNVVLRKANCL